MNIGIVLLVIGGAIGVICSLLSVWVLMRRNRWNGYNRLIMMLSFSQLVYDISVVMVAFPGEFNELLYIALRTTSGLWATFVTNVLSTVIVYTAWTLKSYDVRKNIQSILALVTVPSTICGVLVSITLHFFPGHPFDVVSNIYFWARIASIVYNILCYIILVIKLKRIQSLPAYRRKGDPLHILAARYKYYPIIQIVTRVFVSFYEYKYGHDYDFDVSDPLRRRVALVLYILTLPSAGLGFFVIFMVVSPGAFRALKIDLYDVLTSCRLRDLDDRTWRGNITDKLLGEIAPFMTAPDGISTPGGGTEGGDTSGMNASSGQDELSWHYASDAASSDNDELGGDASAMYRQWSEDELSTEVSRLYSTGSASLRSKMYSGDSSGVGDDSGMFASHSRDRDMSSSQDSSKYPLTLSTSVSSRR
jgi:hypothetical protein